MKNLIKILMILAITSCGSKKPDSIELITEKGQQEAIFHNLIKVTNNVLSDSVQNDSLAFLLLPVQASCPACRNKTIDSIVKHRNTLTNNHYIIISANGGRKTIDGYFHENNKKLPVIENKLFLDSSNQAYKLELYTEKPTIYYSYNRKVYKKVSAIPATVRDDLREFFSGHRDKTKQLAKNN
jgi:hypothetical protein